MIISRTPYRISFFGGGTDYPPWYLRHGGAVFVSSIDKYCYLNVRYLPPFFEHRIRVVYSKIECAQTVDEISHPAVRAVLDHVGIDRGVEIHHVGDLPARSGMGSSSAFTVGLLNATRALQGNLISKHDLAMQSVHLEQDVLQEAVGSQDQVSTAYGGLNHVVFHRNGEITIHPLPVARDRLDELRSHLMLFYTGIIRTASDVVKSFIADMEARRRQLRILKDFVTEAISIVDSGRDLRAFGELLHEAWQLKRELSSAVSNTEVDQLYAAALEAGAIGGKLTGAGGGGFLLLFVPPEAQKRVLKTFDQLIHVPFGFEFQGSQIIYYNPEADYRKVEEWRNKKAVRPFRELCPPDQEG